MRREIFTGLPPGRQWVWDRRLRGCLQAGSVGQRDRIARIFGRRRRLPGGRRDPRRGGQFLWRDFWGGTGGFGVVYRLDPAGNETVLLAFGGGVPGVSPSAGVIRDAKGNLYGTAAPGAPASLGVFYRLDMRGR